MCPCLQDESLFKEVVTNDEVMVKKLLELGADGNSIDLDKVLAKKPRSGVVSLLANSGLLLPQDMVCYMGYLSDRTSILFV